MRLFRWCMATRRRIACQTSPFGLCLGGHRFLNGLSFGGHRFLNLAFARRIARSKLVLRAPSTLPTVLTETRSECSAIIAYRTDAVAKVPRDGFSLCCGQTMIQHGFGHQLSDLGVEPVPHDTKLSFAQLQSMLDTSTTALGRSCKLVTVQEGFGIEQLLKSRDGGIFAVHTFHLNAEDIDFVNPKHG